MGLDNIPNYPFLPLAGYYSTGLPALMMFIVSKRLYNFIAQVLFFILLVSLILPVQGIYARNVVSFVRRPIFFARPLTLAQGRVLDLYSRLALYDGGCESADHRQRTEAHLNQARRKMFLLALQLNQAYEAKHKARQAESKASFMKRRFANYIFHEVRVPLNNVGELN